MRATILLATLFATALATGCAKAAEPGSPADNAGDLNGRAFLSTAIQEDGKPKTLAAQTRIMLNFEPGKIGANAGCNHLFGTLKVEGDRLIVTEMGGTDMACEQPRMDQDTWLTTFLSSKPTWQLAGDELTLKTEKAEIKLLDRKQAEPDRPLAGTRWKVESIVDGQSVSSLPGGTEAYLEFADGKVTGSTGCNRLSGNAVVKDSKIEFGPLVTTKMACQGDLGKVENAVVTTLTGTVTMKITADKLELTNAAGKGIHLRAS